VPWPFLRLCSKRLPSWAKNYGLSLVTSNSQGGSTTTSSLLKCSRPIVCSLGCAINAPWMSMKCGRWDAGRQCGRSGDAGKSCPNLRLGQLFCDSPQSHFTTCAKSTEGPNCPENCEIRSGVCTVYLIYLQNTDFQQIPQITTRSAMAS
jgi:hypothetical protein